MFVDRVLALCRAQKISKNKLLTEINVNKSAFVNWENRGNIPSGEIVAKIADYFNVTTDYLLCRTDDPRAVGEMEGTSPSAAEAAPGEDHMIELYRVLNCEGQEKLLDYADDLVASGKYIKSDPDKLGKAKNA